MVFERVERTCNEFVEVAKRRSLSFSVPAPIFSPAEIISELMEYLDSFSIKVNETAFTNQATKIMEFVTEIIDDTPIAIKNPNIADARIVSDNVDGKKKLFFKFKLINPENSVFVMQNPNIYFQIHLFRA